MYTTLDRQLGTRVEQEVVHKLIDHNGMKVLEVVAKWETDGKHHYKLFWIRTPMSSVEIDGKPNPFVHADFSKSDLTDAGMKVNYTNMRKLEDAARRKVIRKFEETWK